MCITTSAQTTRVITGSVKDKAGTPLPGAIVAAKGGSEITSVDADGTFSLEIPYEIKSVTARCEGMANKSLKIKDGSDLDFRLMPKGDHQWYLTGNFSYCGGNGYNGYFFALMGGSLGKWGWFGKLYLGSSDQNHSASYRGNNGASACVLVSAGVSKRIIKPLHAYVGLGAGSIGEGGVCLEMGLIGKIGDHVLIQGGPQIIGGNGVMGGFNIGVGYAF